MIQEWLSHKKTWYVCVCLCGGGGVPQNKFSPLSDVKKFPQTRTAICGRVSHTSRYDSHNAAKLSYSSLALTRYICNYILIEAQLSLKQTNNVYDNRCVS